MRENLIVLHKSDLLRLLQEKPPLVENLIDPDVQVQPNGIDMTLRSIECLKSAGYIDFNNSERKISETYLLSFSKLKSSEDWIFLKLGSYIVKINEILNIPKNIIGIAAARSSLIRSGCSISSGIIDSGYRGRLTFLLNVCNKKGIYLKKNARIVQVMFINIGEEVEKGYEGIYKLRRSLNSYPLNI